MAIDWDKFDKDIDEAIETAGERTDAKLASIMSSITRLTDDEIADLFPQPADVERLKELMKVVKSADDRNIKINSIIENSEKFAGVIITLLEKFA